MIIIINITFFLYRISFTGYTEKCKGVVQAVYSGTNAGKEKGQGNGISA